MINFKFETSLWAAAGVVGALFAGVAPCEALAAAPAAQFTLTPIVVNGSANVNATAINASGTIVGTVDDGSSTFDHIKAFVLSGSHVRILPPVMKECEHFEGACTPYPTAINARGDVAGSWHFAHTGAFLWRTNHYVSAYSNSNVILGVAECPSALGGLNVKGEIFYNEYFCNGVYQLYAGIPPAVTQQNVFGGYTELTSMNDSGVLCGDTYISKGNTLLRSIFYGRNGNFNTLPLPGSLSAMGCHINDSDHVAGVYYDHSSVHGFLYHAHAFKSFDMPQTPSFATIMVHAINNTARVVGTYTDAVSNLQHIFWFNGTTVSQFGSYPSSYPNAETLHLALSDNGTLVVSYTAAGFSSVSFSVTCSGTGC